MDRRAFLASASIATAAVSSPAVARGRRKLKMVTPWPRNSPGLHTSAERVAQMITESSEGRIEVDVYAAGELVDAFEIFDAVSEGVADIYHSPEYYWQGKSPAFSYYAAVPFGLTANEMAAWIHFGGGQALWDELSAQFNLKPLLTGSTGAQMGGWYDKEITSLESFKGLRVRMPGLGGEVLKKNGAIVVSLPGGEIVPALKSGAIDASEWVCPWLDMHLGLEQAAKYYYYPGFQEPGPGISLSINKDLWDGLDLSERRVFQTATAAEFTLSLAEFNTQNSLALQKMKDQGVDIRSFDNQLLTSLSAVADELLVEISASDPLTKRIHDSFIEFRNTVMKWSDISDLAFMNARRAAYSRKD